MGQVRLNFLLTVISANSPFLPQTPNLTRMPRPPGAVFLGDQWAAAGGGGKQETSVPLTDVPPVNGRQQSRTASGSEAEL